MMQCTEVDANNVEALQQHLLKAVSGATFVAVDTEFSGLSKRLNASRYGGFTVALHCFCCWKLP